MTTLRITARDTRTIAVQYPGEELEGARARARLWVGSKALPTWFHDWDTELATPGISVDGERVLIETATADWDSAPSGARQDLVADLEVELSRAGTVRTDHFRVFVTGKALGGANQ